MTHPEPSLARYVLSKEEINRVYRHQLLPLLTGLPSQERPTMLLLTGQPGAGHQAAATEIKTSENSRTRPTTAVIDTTLLHRYHRDYFSLSQQARGPEGARQKVASAVREAGWTHKILTEAARRRVNVIVVADIEHPSDLDTIVEPFATSPEGLEPYRNEAGLMGTPRAESLLTCLITHQKYYENSGLTQLPAPNTIGHDRGYDHMLTVADWFDADPRLHVISIYRREAIPIHENNGQTNPTAFTEFNHLPGAVARKTRIATGEWGDYSYHREHEARRLPTRVVLDELVRKQPLSYPDSVAFEQHYKWLSKRMRPEWAATLIQVRDDAQNVLTGARLPYPKYHPGAAARLGIIHEVVLFDYFQLLTTADMHAITRLMEQFTHVELAVIDETSRPPVIPPDELLDFYAERQRHGAPERNPLTVEERIRGVVAALRAYGLPESDITVTKATAPELALPELGNTHPTYRASVGFLTDPYDPADRARNDIYRKILPHRICEVLLPRPRPRIGDLAHAYHRGEQHALSDLPAGYVDVFLEIRGPARVFTTDLTESTTGIENLRVAAYGTDDEHRTDPRTPPEDFDEHDFPPPPSSPEPDVDELGHSGP
ncbi:zeta toxin family protein [Nocardia sp. 004]|uniref:zeta toxin family protein n=1 Tax=Nocardia sp. 004 TaxID=3385978 RepID=UPI0039A32F03